MIEDEVINLEEIPYGLDITNYTIKGSYNNYDYSSGLNYQMSSRILREGDIIPLMCIDKEYVDKGMYGIQSTNNSYLNDHPLLDWVFKDNKPIKNKDTGEWCYIDVEPPLIAARLRKAIRKLIADNHTRRRSRRNRSTEITCKFENCTNQQIDIILANLVLKLKKEIQTEFLLKKNIKGREFKDGEVDCSHNYYKYADVISHFFNKNTFGIFKGKDPLLQYVVGNYYLAHYNPDTGHTDPLVCVVIKKKHLTYAKACYMMNEPIDPSCLEMWVKDDFDVVRSRYSNIRPKYRKYIKNPLLEAGVEIKTVKNFENLFLKYTPPVVHSISEYEDFLKQSSAEALANLRDKHGVVLELDLEVFEN